MVVIQKWQFLQIFFQEIKSRKMCFTKFQKEKTPLQTVKKRTLKSRKINIFPKELTYGFGPKMAIFPSFIFQALQDRKMSFTIFQNEKTPFQAVKTRSLKGRKSDIFPKGLIHSFGTKLAIFPPFFCFWEQKSGKCLLRDSRARKRFTRLQKQEVQKVQKLTFFQRG